ncbi:MAG: hypothetical protein ACJAYN_000649 [Bermanella sp.]|jgi:hypothetical protein
MGCGFLAFIRVSGQSYFSHTLIKPTLHAKPKKSGCFTLAFKGAI